MIRWLNPLLPCLALGLPVAAQQVQDASSGANWSSQDTSIAPNYGLSPETPQPYAGQPQSGLTPLPQVEAFGTSVFPSWDQPTTRRRGTVTATPPAGSTPPSTPLRWGRVIFHPHVSYNLLYGTGILSGPGQEENTFLNTLSPGITVNLGPRWTVDYTPSLDFYSSEAYDDTLNHAVSLNGTVPWGEWMLSVGYDFRSSNTPTIETAAQTAQDTHGLNVGADYHLGPKTSVQLGFEQNLRFAEAYADSLSWSTTDWLDYRLNPKLSVAGGVRLGYDMMDPGTDMTSERLLGRLQGRVGEKFTYSLQGGVEFRQFQDSDASTKVSPTVDASLSYQVFEPTSLSLFASHDVGTSYYSDQFTETTRVGGGFQQRLLTRLFLNLSGGYSIQKYETTFGTEAMVREDDNVYFQAGLSTALLRRLNLSVFYRYASNASDQAGYSFDSNQIGFQLAYAW